LEREAHRGALAAGNCCHPRLGQIGWNAHSGLQGQIRPALLAYRYFRDRNAERACDLYACFAQQNAEIVRAQGGDAEVSKRTLPDVLHNSDRESDRTRGN
jgi:hypothetical protein